MYRKKILSGVVAVVFIMVAVFGFHAYQKAHAGAITNMSIQVSGTTYTITLTPATTIPAGGKINAAFHWKNSDRTRVPDTISLGSGSSASISGVSEVGDERVVATVGSQITGGTEVTIVVEGLTNPTIANRYHAIFWTQDDSGTMLDGGSESTTPYRAYYVIGNVIVMGRVTNPSGEAMSNTWVQLNTAGFNPTFGGDSTDDLGYYSVGVMYDDYFPPIGTELKISAHAGGDDYELGMTDEETITYNDAVITKNIQFVAPTKTISGRVTNPDGSGVAEARVNFWKMSGSGYVDTTTDSNGYYTALVKGGRWDGMPQADYDDIWSYGQPPSSVTFQNDTSIESQTVNFSVLLANCTITGSVRLPDGSAPANQHDFWVGAHAMMMGGSGQLDANGNFSIAVPAGTYMLDIMDSSMNYASPDINPFTVGDGETYDLGVINLLTRDAIISGRVVDSNGNGIGNQHVSAFMMKGHGWADTNADGDGYFSLRVFPGKWMLHVPFWSGDGNTNSYVLNGNPPEVKVSSGETSTLNLNLIQTSATITGSVVDANGNALSDMYGWVFADKGESSDFMGHGLGGSINRGQYSFNVPPGTYNIGLGPMPGSNYSAGNMTSVTVADGQTATHNITVYANDMTVTGSVLDENGNPVTGVFLEVFATNDTGGWQNAMLDQSGGAYTINVASAVDPWSLGFFVDPRTGYFSERLTDNDVSGNAGDTITKNITVRRANSTISGVVVDGDGNPMEDIFVFADNRSAEQDRSGAHFMGPMFMNDNITDVNGAFSISVPSGTYYVSASLPRTSRPDLINPERVEVVIGADETVSGVTLAFKSADVPITGTVTLDGESQEDAYVWAWSEEGGYNETTADTNGEYTLNVTEDDTWHLGVNNDVVNTTDYVRSNEVVIATGTEDSFSQDIEMETVEDGLVEPVSSTFSASSPTATNLSDGSRVTVPANAMGTSGNVTLNASSTSELPRTTNAKPVTTGLDLTASTSTGSAITSFNSDISVTIPYDESILDDLMITEDDLVAAYWDETNGVWQPLDNYSIDKENNKIVLSTSHFTTFAIVSDTVNTGDGTGDTATSVTGSTVYVNGSGSSSSTPGTKAVIDSWKATRYYTMAKKAVQKLKLIIKGRRFKNDATVTIGSKEAASVTVTSGGKKLVAKFEMKDLVKNKKKKEQKIKIVNPNADSEKADKKISLNHIPFDMNYALIFDDDTFEGITNTQRILYNKKYLQKREITGVYDKATKNAVKEFQTDYGISAVGIVGPQTQMKLRELKKRY